MRLRITHALSGSIDGVQLSQFVVGRTYEVGQSVGSFLIAVGAAELDQSHDDSDHDGALIGVRRSTSQSTPTHG